MHDPVHREDYLGEVSFPYFSGSLHVCNTHTAFGRSLPIGREWLNIPLAGGITRPLAEGKTKKKGAAIACCRDRITVLFLSVGCLFIPLLQLGLTS